MSAAVRILAIETSCDETGVAIITDGRRIEVNVVASQVALHAASGGIVPEVAARQQLRWIGPAISEAHRLAGTDWRDIDAIAVTHGPGLIGSLLVGVGVAKALAVSRDLPLIGVNHIEGHIYANWLTDDDPSSEPLEPPFPLLCLVVSGGHTQLILMAGHGRYRLLGQTVDDAAGEAFDKVGRLLGLPYPGGPAISAVASDARPVTRFPRARTAGRFDFSFSGLKTAVMREVEGYRARGEPIPVDGLAAAFEEAVVGALTARTVTAAEEFGVAAVALGGGVAANRSLRATMAERLNGIPLLVPRPAWCTDNAAMIGAAAAGHFRAGERADRSLRAVPSLALPWTTG